VSRRTERIGNVIRALVAEAIQSRLSDPRIAPLTSITRVEVSADLAVARVHVSVMAEEPRQALCLQALRHAAGRLRSLVAQRIVLRHVPRLDFLLDSSVQGAFRTVQVIDAAMAELGQRPPWEADEAAESPEEAEAGPADEVRTTSDESGAPGPQADSGPGVGDHQSPSRQEDG
jgi:ribosome-binding factor A